MKLGIKVPKGEVTLLVQANADFKKNARRGLRQASDVLLKNVQYQLRRQKGNGQPSSPGEPPAMQSGKLAKSFKRLRVRLRKSYGSAGITSDDPAAYVLEYGEARSSRAAGAIGGRRARRSINSFLRGLAPILGGNAVYRVAPRPYLGPAADDAEEEITRILTDVVTL